MNTISDGTELLPYDEKLKLYLSQATLSYSNLAVADAKCAAIFTFTVAMTAYMIKIYLDANYVCKVLHFSFFLPMFVFVILSGVKAIQAFRPKLVKKYDKENIFSWLSLSSYEKSDDFIDAIKDLNWMTSLKYVVKTNHIVSRISQEKYENIRKQLIFTVVATAIFLLYIFIIFILKP